MEATLQGTVTKHATTAHEIYRRRASDPRNSNASKRFFYSWESGRSYLSNIRKRKWHPCKKNVILFYLILIDLFYKLFCKYDLVKEDNLGLNFLVVIPQLAE